MTKESQSTYPLRLPRSVKAEVERRAKADGVSVNQFVATAVAEKLAVMNTAAFFAERRERADFAAFDRLMRRKRGEAPVRRTWLWTAAGCFRARTASVRC
jgi:HicB family